MIKFKITPCETTTPSILKFEANQVISSHDSYEYNDIDAAKNSPLAEQLFYLPFVKTIYISGNFIAIEKYDIVTWQEVKDEVATQIEDYLNSGKPAVLTTPDSEKYPVTVYAESTPNPAVMKFVANKKLVAAPFEFKTRAEAKDSALAQMLFHFPQVKEVFFDENYVAVTKDEITEWDNITIDLRMAITDFIAEGNKIINMAKVDASVPPARKNDALDETSRQIIDILDEYVKPAVASDGGHIMFESYDAEEKTVKVILQGACSGCPSSTFTLKNGIETMLKNMLNDKVNQVIAING